ncbi:MAG: 4Fe-4S binding protein [Syntrophomonadaceae bacterium]|jgi:Pyruvate/2-oxoacid:ferredoxin oxidoreductase delta subunit|nr:4Fe-4S binding protein [Syntrophomonadaceae bacterium]MDH7497100.1 4Fe-4S binding protein [Syntrophomonadaceae bacterium]
MNAWWLLLALPAAAAVCWVKLERGWRPRQSTLDFWRLSPQPWFKKVEGYVYGAASSSYLKPAGWRWFTRMWARSESAAGYHGKVLTGADASRIVSLRQPLLATDLEHVIPYPRARSIILQEPEPSLAVLECPCRAQKADACQPRDVCLVVGEPFVSFAVDHQPDKARRISRSEALAIIEAEERRGHIHTAWFKDAMHDRFYAICNCCSCCCLGMESYRRGVPRLAHSGYRPLFDADTCTTCGVCRSLCPFAALEQDQSGMPVLSDERCMGCGLCVSHCPTGAVVLVLAPERGIPLDVERLAARPAGSYSSPVSEAAGTSSSASELMQ